MKSVAIGLALGAAVLGTAWAQASLPENTINCSSFRKLDPNTWATVGVANFDIGTVKNMNLSNTTVQSRFMNLGGIDLFEALERKCGGKPI